MRKYLLACSVALLPLLSLPALAAEQDVKIVQNVLLQNDISAWLNSGKSLFNWSSRINKDNIISKSTISPAQLYFIFDSNSYTAEEKFNKVPQLIDGVVYSVKKDSQGQPLVTFLTDNYIDGFVAGGLSKDEVSDFYKGKAVQFVCYKFSYEDSILYSSQCATKGQYFNQMASNLIKDIDSSSIFNNRKGQNSDIYNKLYTVLYKISKTDLIAINNKCSTSDYLNDNDCIAFVNSVVRKLY